MFRVFPDQAKQVSWLQNGGNGDISGHFGWLFTILQSFWHISNGSNLRENTIRSRCLGCQLLVQDVDYWTASWIHSEKITWNSTSLPDGAGSSMALGTAWSGWLTTLKCWHELLHPSHIAIDVIMRTGLPPMAPSNIPCTPLVASAGCLAGVSRVDGR